ncbi:VRR-NUC domain-containing protein [Faecalispora jeddahensis]|uniref:VRR-NUC domain-containing protein n=1 Tax=Faecalispora jeddahensis TaxID=1414721 RepID=UPI0005A5E952|nr:VRR-NUC domain-containing protein [Faecalispora jeddahensis]
MRESAIEAYLRDRVKELGGKAYKFVSPGNTGVPDRMVCLPGGRVVFVELKAPGEKPTKLQRNRHRELRGFGQIVFGCVDSKADVDLMLRIMNADVTPAETAKAIEELEMRDVE